MMTSSILQLCSITALIAYLTACGSTNASEVQNGDGAAAKAQLAGQALSQQSAGQVLKEEEASI